MAQQNRKQINFSLALLQTKLHVNHVRFLSLLFREERLITSILSLLTMRNELLEELRRLIFTSERNVHENTQFHNQFYVVLSPQESVLLSLINGNWCLNACIYVINLIDRKILKISIQGQRRFVNLCHLRTRFSCISLVFVCLIKKCTLFAFYACTTSQLKIFDLFFSLRLKQSTTKIF